VAKEDIHMTRIAATAAHYKALEVHNSREVKCRGTECSQLFAAARCPCSTAKPGQYTLSLLVYPNGTIPVFATNSSDNADMTGGKG
jgi:hypothetical protein